MLMIHMHVSYYRLHYMLRILIFYYMIIPKIIMY